MLITVLVCHADGTQEVQQREVPEDWFAPAVSAAAAEPEGSAPLTEDEIPFE